MLITVLYLTGLSLTGCYGLDTFPGKDELAHDTGVVLADSGGPGQPLDDTGDTGGFDGNAAPVADAGADFEHQVGQIVTLDGSASSDPDGDPLDFTWALIAQPQGSTATLINQTRVDPQLFLDRAGLFTVELSVSDGARADVDTIEITAVEPNDGPTANAGAAQSVDVGEVVLLNGAGSTDPDGDALNYTWSILTKPSGSLAQLNDPTSERPSFTADRAGSYEIQLIVDDGLQSSAPDAVRVTASEPSSGGDDGCLSCGGASQGQLMQRAPFLVAMLHGGPMILLSGLLAWRRREED